MTNPYGNAGSVDFESLRRKLDAKIERAFSKVQQVEHSTAELREKRAQSAEQLTDEQVESLRASILVRERTPEWQRVIERITLGEVTWRQVAVSYFSGTMEPTIRLAFDSLDNVPALTPEQRERIDAELKSRFEPKVDESDTRSPDSERSPGSASDGSVAASEEKPWKRAQPSDEQRSSPRDPEPHDLEDDFDTMNFLRE